MPRPVALLAMLVLCGCAPFGQSQTCLLPSQKPMIEAQLFFGRDIEGRGPVSDTEWSDFSSSAIARNFPDGFTVNDGEGMWRDPRTGNTVHEQSKIVLIAVENSPMLATKLKDVMAAYRARFHQQSVGLISHTVCAAF